jgi:hypothetical protein
MGSWRSSNDQRAPMQPRAPKTIVVQRNQLRRRQRPNSHATQSTDRIATGTIAVDGCDQSLMRIERATATHKPKAIDVSAPRTALGTPAGVGRVASLFTLFPNDKVERRGVSPASNEADLSQTSIPSLAYRRCDPAIAPTDSWRVARLSKPAVPRKLNNSTGQPVHRSPTRSSLS